MRTTSRSASATVLLWVAIAGLLVAGLAIIALVATRDERTEAPAPVTQPAGAVTTAADLSDRCAAAFAPIEATITANPTGDESLDDAGWDALRADLLAAYDDCQVAELYFIEQHAVGPWVSGR